jgi:hypothetical protein
MYEAYTKDKVVLGMIIFEAMGYDHVLDDELHQLWMYQLPEDAAPCSRFADMVLKCVLFGCGIVGARHLIGVEAFSFFFPSLTNFMFHSSQHPRKPSMTARTS